MFKQAMLFNSYSSIILIQSKTFWLEVENKKPLSTKPTIAQIEISS